MGCVWGVFGVWGLLSPARGRFPYVHEDAESTSPALVCDLGSNRVVVISSLVLWFLAYWEHDATTSRNLSSRFFFLSSIQGGSCCDS